MDVALLNGWFWPEVQRGSERIIHDLAVDLVELGHRPRLLTAHAGRRDVRMEDGFEIVRVHRPSERLLALRRFQTGMSHLPAVARELAGRPADVAHAFYPTDAVVAARWARRSGRPAVFSYMGIPRRDALANQRLRLAIHERAINGCDAVTALSRAARDGLWRWLGVEAEVIYPGVDLRRFTPAGTRTEHPSIACAADPDDARKRVGLLVEAFGLLRRELPTARLRLMRPRDPASARALTDAHEGIELFEPDPAGVIEVMRSAWATGLASYNEAFGLVFVESLACGTPVFGMRDGGVPEIVDSDAVGSLFETDDPAAVARAMRAAVELSRDGATAGRCRTRAERFDTMTGARAYEELYRGLAARRG